MWNPEGCGSPVEGGHRDGFPIPSMNYGAVEQDTGTLFQVHTEQSHQPTPHTTPLAPEALVWTKEKSPCCCTLSVRGHFPHSCTAGSKGKQIEPGTDSEPAWRSPQELSWSPSASLDAPESTRSSSGSQPKLIPGLNEGFVVLEKQGICQHHRHLH